jgi:hypothetical protein
MLALRQTPQPRGPALRIYVTQCRVGQLYPQAPGSIFVAFYDSQGYSGSILNRIHTEHINTYINIYIYIYT